MTLIRFYFVCYSFFLNTQLLHSWDRRIWSF
eukprot:COSAG02_NODE_2193_length_9555_cov_102.183481_2_plen_31_part_00